jgi:hypothetical protein
VNGETWGDMGETGRSVRNHVREEITSREGKGSNKTTRCSTRVCVNNRPRVTNCCLLKRNGRPFIT